MQNYRQKISQLKWLKSMGVEHFLNNNKKFEANLIDNIEKNATHNDRAWTTNLPDKKATSLNENMSSYQTTPESFPSTKSGVNIQLKQKQTDNDMVVESRKLANAAKDIDQLRDAVENFSGCNLKNFANNTVFADGNRNAKVVLIGEAPGASEDKIGIPFCGESGKLLDKMLETIGLSRETNTYITNTVFWRPPGNRRPTQEEIDICRPFVEKHIALLAPELIILVGATAATSLLGKHDGISKIRQNLYSYSNQYLDKLISLTAIFHPAYLLRQPSQKKPTWYDLIKIQQYLGEKGIKS